MIATRVRLCLRSGHQDSVSNNRDLAKLDADDEPDHADEPEHLQAVLECF